MLHSTYNIKPRNLIYLRILLKFRNMEYRQDYDYLSLNDDKCIRSVIKEETLLFSDKIIKINRYNMSQDRQIVISNKAIYNFKKKELKRRIDLSKMKGISITKVTDEFVIHGNDIEYDYDYVSSKRRTILEVLGPAFNKETQSELKLCVLELKSLKNLVTLKTEKKKDASFSRMPTTNIVSVEEYLYGGKAQFKRNSTVIKEIIYIGKEKDHVKEVNYEDFQIISVIGRGSFGKVCLVEYKNTGELYAMKSIKKDILIDQEQIENTILEKKILQSVDHPFLCSLVFCFQTEDRIYFIMNFIRGGELFQHLKRFKIFNEEQVKFYAAQIGMALQYLHEKGIIYRDLKPENILMNEEGYLQLADFGMAKALNQNEKATSFCGTPEYLAPEVIQSEGHDCMADWWSFGILV